MALTYPDPPVGQTRMPPSPPVAPAPVQTQTQGFPVSPAGQVFDPCGGVYIAPRAVTPEETAAAQELYDQMLPMAQNAYVSYFHTHTPPELMPAMRELVGDGVAPPTAPEPDPLVAPVSNGGSVMVVDAASVLIGVATATVANSVLTNVKMP